MVHVCYKYFYKAVCNKKKCNVELAEINQRPEFRGVGGNCTHTQNNEMRQVSLGKLGPQLRYV